jgi:hypothetical protein
VIAVSAGVAAAAVIVAVVIAVSAGVAAAAVIVADKQI